MDRLSMNPCPVCAESDVYCDACWLGYDETRPEDDQ
jgi:hypothetical protein